MDNFLKTKNNFSILSGIIFLVIFSIVYLITDSNLYWLRDDGIITLSHSKNFIDYGFIGVNPSGERIEAFSAPVQFWIYTVLYALFGMGYETYAYFQIILFTFLLGYGFGLFFEKSFDNLIIVFLSALGLTFFKSFFLWHGSVMENPITNVLFLLTFYILYNSIKTNNIQYIYIPVVFLATISRLDSVYHIAPLLFIFSVWWFVQNKKNINSYKFKGLLFSIFVFILWLFYHIYRYLYFGDIIPNTAYGQNININDIAINNIKYILGLVKVQIYFIWQYGIFYLALIIPIGIFLYKQDKPKLFLFVLIFVITITVIMNPLIFGKTRLDLLRTTNYMTIFIFLAMGIIFNKLQQHKTFKPKYTKYIILFLLSSNVFFNYVFVGFVPNYKLKSSYVNRDLCCNIKWFKINAYSKFKKLQKQEKLHRPMVSNPDLGIISYKKQFNMLDVGLLGSMAIVHIKKAYGVNSQIFIDAYTKWFAPDYVSYHWIANYKKLLNSKQFKELYEIQEFNDSNNVLTVLGKRKATMKDSHSAERYLIDNMAKNPTTVKLKNELKICEMKKNIITDCLYVVRTAYRFAPELRKRGMQVELENIFSDSRTAPFDMFLITGYKNPQLVHQAIDFIAQQQKTR